MYDPKENPKLWDRRTLERNIRKGLMTRKDVDKYLKSLPDAEEKKVELDPDTDNDGTPVHRK